MISVLICTHNPRREFLERTLQALARQTLPADRWELLFIDNASEPAVVVADSTWHPNTRFLREEQLGLTAARVRGIRESKGDLLVFVDDDNVLDPDYLAEALRVAETWPMLGAWGGTAVGEFEQPPRPELGPYLRYIAVREVESDLWARLPGIHPALPYGAGMCVRRVVSEKYALQLQADPRRAGLDPVGERLMRAGDLDLALTSNDCGLGAGVFRALRLTHLIPAGRLELSYLAELIETAEYCGTLLRHYRGEATFPETALNRLVFWLKTLRLPAVDQQMARAFYRGKCAALREAASSH